MKCYICQILLLVWVICSLMLIKSCTTYFSLYGSIKFITRWRNKQIQKNLKYKDKNNLLIIRIAYVCPLMKHNLLMSLFSHWHTCWHYPLSHINFQTILYAWNKYFYIFEEKSSILTNWRHRMDEFDYINDIMIVGLIQLQSISLLKHTCDKTFNTERIF